MSFQVQDDVLNCLEESRPCKTLKSKKAESTISLTLQWVSSEKLKLKQSGERVREWHYKGVDSVLSSQLVLCDPMVLQTCASTQMNFWGQHRTG